MINREHGSPYDRGGADYYYGRPINPHWYPLGTGHGDVVKDLSQAEVDQYMAGYKDAEVLGDRKDYT